MDTVLNLGLNDEVVEGLAAKRGERFAFDCYRRLLDMFGDVVLGIDHALFEAQIHAVKVGGSAGGERGGGGALMWRSAAARKCMCASHARPTAAQRRPPLAWPFARTRTHGHSSRPLPPPTHPTRRRRTG